MVCVYRHTLPLHRVSSKACHQWFPQRSEPRFEHSLPLEAFENNQPRGGVEAFEGTKGGSRSSRLARNWPGSDREAPERRHLYSPRWGEFVSRRCRVSRAIGYPPPPFRSNLIWFFFPVRGHRRSFWLNGTSTTSTIRPLEQSTEVSAYTGTGTLCLRWRQSSSAGRSEAHATRGRV